MSNLTLTILKATVAYNNRRKILDRPELIMMDDFCRQKKPQKTFALGEKNARNFFIRRREEFRNLERLRANIASQPRFKPADDDLHHRFRYQSRSLSSNSFAKKSWYDNYEWWNRIGSNKRSTRRDRILWWMPLNRITNPSNRQSITHRSH